VLLLIHLHYADIKKNRKAGYPILDDELDTSPVLSNHCVSFV